MYYATAGQQATQQPQGARGGLPMGQAGLGQSGFPPITGAGGLGRGGPPGFQSRASDSSDFPALGLPHAQHLSTSNSTYASQAQTSQAASQSHIQQAIYLQQQQQQLGTLAPPPPPGIGGPASSPNQPNGMPGGAVGENRDEFPALGGVDGKERIPGYLKMNPQIPPSPPPTLPNGASNSQSNTGTPSTNPPHLTNATNGPPSSAESSWPRHQSPSEPLIRPVQQILSSPVDKWGLKALLYEIKTQMGKGDRGVLIFGEELSDLGVDVTSEEALYPSFVTPWAEPGSLQHPHRIEEAFHIPTCYNVHAPPVSTKLPNFAEDTLFYAFYTSPQDVLQLEVAEELFVFDAVVILPPR
ncbi:CCR4-NOT transcription complex subunit 2, partial [Tremellales sp. Uapishka_1]